MRDNGGGDVGFNGSTAEPSAPGAEIDRLARNQRLAAFVAEHRQAQARGDPLRESDALLCAWIESGLKYQNETALSRAELERRAFALRGGRMQ